MAAVGARELSPRQREILALVAAGRTSKEIAGDLGISESTVNWHLSNAFERLGASSRAEAVALAMREDSRGTADGTPIPERPAEPTERPPLPLPSVLLAVVITLILGLLGGAFLAGLPAVGN
jgi:DNA-binding CsgD family transcriptional regulator